MHAGVQRGDSCCAVSPAAFQVLARGPLHSSLLQSSQCPDEESWSTGVLCLSTRECRKEKEKYGVYSQDLTLFSTFSLQNEGTRLQKDLRTYLASVKGKRQTCPGQAGLHGTQGMASPCSVGRGGRVCGVRARAIVEAHVPLRLLGDTLSRALWPWLKHGLSVPQPCMRPPRS